MSSTATYSVTGMTCDHCVGAVSAELQNLAGVSDVTVDLNPEGPSAVTVTSDGPLTDQQVAAALDEAAITGALPPEDPLVLAPRRSCKHQRI
ncbi:MAG: heavy-metal-associated domain-containing protein [Mycobacteriales bacterium]